MIPYVNDPDFRLFHGDCLEVLGALPDGSADAVVTSPPYLDARPEYAALASWPGQTVLDPFGGSGTTARAARSLGRNSILIEKSAEWCALAAGRLGQQSLLAGDAA